MANYNIPVYPKSSNNSEYGSTFTAYVNNDGFIVKVDRYNNQQAVVGVDNAKFEEVTKRAEEAEKQCDEFYNKLVECGIIEKEKTQEEKNEELMKQMLKTMKAMENRIKKIEGGNDNGGKPKKSSGQIPKDTNAEEV